MDGEIRGGGRSSSGGGGLKKVFSTLWSSVWSKNKGVAPPKALPMDPPLRLQVKSIREKNVFSQTYLIGDTKDTNLNNCVKGLDVG